MGEGCALRSAGRSAGEEQPGGIVGTTIGQRNRRGRHKSIPLVAGCDHHLHRRRVRGALDLGESFDIGCVFGIGDNHRRSARLHDVGHLGRMKSGVHRNCNQPGVPDGEQRFEIFGSVAHQDRHSVTRRKTQFVAKASGGGRHPSGERRPVGVHCVAVGQSGGLGATSSVPLNPNCQVHRCAPIVESDAISFHGPDLGFKWPDGKFGHNWRYGFNQWPPAVKLTVNDARARLIDNDHGVLCTLHPDRGVDAVPVVYAVYGDVLGVPIDTVKPKTSTRLQRHRNLEDDPRATMLIDHWDGDDWARLWWVRVQLIWQATPAPGLRSTLGRLLAERYPQYKDQPFADVLVFDIDGLTGWSATPPTG